MKTIITIQHPQSEQHINRQIGSWADWDLTPLGIAQAEMIGKRLAAEMAGYPCRIRSSDLRRARHTAEIIADCLRTTVIFTEVLREQFLGEAVGKSKNWARDHVQSPVWPHTVDRAVSVDGRLFDGAESLRDVWNRLLPLYHQIVESPEKRWILVSHDGTLGIFYAMWLGWKPEMLEKFALSGKSGGVSFLHEDEEGHRMIERLNDMSYIGETKSHVKGKESL